ncbi:MULTISPECIES: NAD(P)H-binding protein [unclassified Enterococcus]|uniref:NAD(P)H-binding protein n=1 Tax=unclassified Enterococcus TaxID=2608891 RepID=UPI00155466CB|nr:MULTISPECIES: NAD(P)H-binding protein [unclassified Enterococcus]MBS7577954.1 NAD(P)H-binding protein [Enterococcus sp. MMGLQ5-2]MBS7585185.1 NAD(P)H-binding protein [Enterococcus sp. MMGLQ5-1]NPD13042.1 NAD(P)H-binding protein [Enterococcus sp. MMGLQ5-1]NPD37784.1 NAD(P)H-binding protein [Enterococcus sp. MMGLQ5-2]
MRKIVVNGVNGNFGSVVAEKIQQLVPKEKLLFTAPDSSSLQKFQSLGIETAVADYNDVSKLISIFENADKVLLISMPFVGEKRRQAHQNAVEACVKANVNQIVYTSVLSAANPLNPSIENIDHAYTESIIQNTPLDYLILRNSLFAEAFTSEYQLTVNNHQAIITKNAGEGRVAYISRRDAAYAAACALANDLLHRQILNINGFELVSYEAFLAIGNQVTNNQIRYQRQTDEELYIYFDQIGVPRDTDGDFSKSPIQATSEGMVTFGMAVRDGYLDVEVNDFPKLTGRQPLSLKFMFEHLDDFLLGERHALESD